MPSASRAICAPAGAGCPGTFAYVPRRAFSTLAPTATDGPSSGLRTATEFVACRAELTAGASPMLSWGFCLFRVSREPGLGRLLPVVLLPCTWRHRLFDRPRGDFQLRGRRRCFGVSLGPDADAAALTAASTLLRFPTSSPFSRIRIPICPGSWFRLGTRATSPRSVDPSSG